MTLNLFSFANPQEALIENNAPRISSLSCEDPSRSKQQPSTVLKDAKDSRTSSPSSLASFSNPELLSRMEKLSRTERKITHLVLLHLNEIESRKLYAELGYDGMYPYLTKHLGYSEGAAYRRLQSARLLVQVPEISASVEAGRLHLSQLTQVQKCLKETQQKGESFSKERALHLLRKIERKTHFETKKTLAKELNQAPQLNDRVQPQKDDSVRVEITLSQSEYEELLQAKSLLSHTCPSGSLKEVIVTLARQFNHRRLVGRKASKKSPPPRGESDGKSKELVRSSATEKTIKLNPSWCEKEGRSPAPRSSSSQALSSPQASSSSQSAIASRSKSPHPRLSKESLPKPRTRFIPLTQKREVFRKAGFCCEFQDPRTGHRCQSTYQLEIEHIHPFSKGGSHEAPNLRLFCRTHNALAARQWGINPSWRK